ncbi:MAG: 4Fe-4S dicluster domain-containing protein, partial [Bdellovibrionales bacterium]|nr:4Fe-4S dicluster domain-containing protein [Bdellovibrionales bacterium]
LVESHNGRPTKIEGNPKHPSSLGATNAYAQASILSLYDPSRPKAPKKASGQGTWKEFAQAWEAFLAKAKETQGRGLAIISESFSSPSLSALKKEFQTKYPKAQWVSFDDGEQTNHVLEVAGKKLRASYDFSQADVILSLESDFLGKDLDSVRYTKGFSQKRKVDTPQASMNRLYVVEQNYSITGANADHRLPVASNQIYDVLLAVAAQFVSSGVALPNLPKSSIDWSSRQSQWIKECAKDLLAHKGQSVITVGNHQASYVHQLVAVLNRALGAQGQAVSYRPMLGDLSSLDSLASLAKDMQTGNIEAVAILGGNPVYSAPKSIMLKEALAKVPHTLHFAQHCNETTRACYWFLPESHYLESWGDLYNVDGSVSFVQPLIEPLFDSKSKLEFFHFLSRMQFSPSYEILKQSWKEKGLSESAWRQTLIDGMLDQKQNPYVGSFPFAAFPAPKASANVCVRFEHSWAAFDGRFAENAWLQEAPDPITKVSWDNPALISPALAKNLGLENGQLAEFDFGAELFEMPVWIVPGHAANAVTMHLGYGRTVSSSTAKGVGFSVTSLRDAQSPNIISIQNIKGKKEIYPIACTQNHGSMEGRPLVREASLEDFRAHPDFAKEAVEHPPLKSLWKEHEAKSEYQWGMSIDLSACTGCNACTIACQSENNIPVVGKEQVINGREMNWIRIDRYYSGPEDDPMVVHQPVACVHCENAPCEQVCPVNATVHDDEGLNTMVYNRCIGTRYCSNNCPYKVRRFNFFNYTKDTPELMKMASNPDVTVRFRGVMEKCTYCVQRINGAKHQAVIEDRQVKDGEITTACQQVCPADAIAFGNLKDPESRVSQMKKRNQNYEMLAELNIKPRTSYLAQIRNPNPAMPSHVVSQEGAHL